MSRPDSALMLQLLQETRDDVKRLVARDAATAERLADLERRVDAYEDPPRRSTNLKRDAGLTLSAGAVVAIVLQVLAAMGWAPRAPAASPTPTAIVAPAP